MRTAVFCLAAGLVVAFAPTSVHAQGTVPVTITVPTDEGSAAPAPVDQPRSPAGGGRLPRTGMELAALVVFGLTLIAGGMWLVGVSRRFERGKGL